jgi:hypothetical protein
MRVTLTIPDELLAAAIERLPDASPALLVDPATAPRIVSALVMGALSAFAAESEAPERVALTREELEAVLLGIAGSEPERETPPDARGVPIAVRTRGARAPLPIAEVPEAFTLERGIATIHDALSVAPELRVAAFTRLMGTNDRHVELVLATAVRPFSVDARLGPDDEIHTVRFHPAGSIVIGTMDGEPAAARRARR